MKPSEEYQMMLDAQKPRGLRGAWDRVAGRTMNLRGVFTLLGLAGATAGAGYAGSKGLDLWHGVDLEDMTAHQSFHYKLKDGGFSVAKPGDDLAMIKPGGVKTTGTYIGDFRENMYCMGNIVQSHAVPGKEYRTQNPTVKGTAYAEDGTKLHTRLIAEVSYDKAAATCMPMAQAEQDPASKAVIDSLRLTLAKAKHDAIVLGPKPPISGS